MDTLRKILGFMVFLLVIVVGAGIYLTTQTGHGLNLGMGGHNQTAKQDTEQNITNKNTQQKVTVVLEPDIRNYIDEINKGIGLINEANGLITADPFFADPPKVTQGTTDSTPYDKLLPEDRKQPVLLLPDGTYQIIGDTGLDMRNIHRGIYKLGQGMTVLNSVLDKMNDDVRNNNFPNKNTSSTMPGMTNSMMPNNSAQNTTGSMSGLPGMSMPAQGMTGSVTSTGGLSGLLGSGTLSTVLYLMLSLFFILAIISIIGFIMSLFRTPKTEPKPE